VCWQIQQKQILVPSAACDARAVDGEDGAEGPVGMDAEIVEFFAVFQFDHANGFVGTGNGGPIGRGGKAHAEKRIAGDGKTFEALAVGDVVNFNRSKFAGDPPAATSLAPSGRSAWTSVLANSLASVPRSPNRRHGAAELHANRPPPATCHPERRRWRK